MTDALREFLDGARIDAAVFALRPDYRVLLIAVDGLTPGPSDDRGEALLCEAVQGRGTPGTFIDDRLTIACGSGAIRLVKLQREGKSLLPIGMTGVEGEFSRGDVIAVREEGGVEIARGLANYSSFEARLICRKPSGEFERLLGYAAEPEMLHRDNLVITR